MSSKKESQSPQKSAYEKLAAAIIKNLEKRAMAGEYYASAAQCRDALLAQIPAASTVTWGGSMSLVEAGIIEALNATPALSILDRSTATTKQEARELYAKQTLCDYFLMSTNAITIDGELVNIDGNGNRIACLAWGPKHVFVVAGMNKVVSDVSAGYARVRNIASPPNNIRLGHKTPCAVQGHCYDCFSDECICNQILITRRNSGQAGRIKIFLVGETLGY